MIAFGDVERFEVHHEKRVDQNCYKGHSGFSGWNIGKCSLLDSDVSILGIFNYALSAVCNAGPQDGDFLVEIGIYCATALVFGS